MEYAAIYLPVSPNGIKRSRRGFYSENSAWSYIYSQMCDSCIFERDAALNGKAGSNWDEDRPPNDHPACACEWEVIISDQGIDDYDIPIIKNDVKWKTNSDF